MLHMAVMAALLLAVGAPGAAAQAGAPAVQEHDVVLRDFRFDSGETLPALRLHYLTLGTPARNAAGEIVNGVLLLHGTSGSSRTWLEPGLADELFGRGQPLDAARYFVIIPDSIGAGGSSKPSDGLRAKFPRYRYPDVVRAHYQLLTGELGIRRLRLVAGTSMGGMQTWLWGTTYPDFMDALVPVASQPTAMSGRNWISRRIRIEAIRNDPDWNGGNYERNPTRYAYTLPLAALTTESVVRLQEQAPTRAAADALYATLVENAKRNDANNQLYAVEASMDYDPSPHLHKIKARLLAINFADDEVNPPELHVVEPAMRAIPRATFVLVPAGPQTHGHYTYMRAALWKAHLAEFLATLDPAQAKRTVWEGVYSEAQAARGKKLYVERCAACHMEGLQGADLAPALKGQGFLLRWSAQSILGLMDNTQKTMPADGPGTLSAEANADITAYLLQVNKFPAGRADMPSDAALLRSIELTEAP